MYPETILPIAAHIPHAGTLVPDAVRGQFTVSPQELWREIAMLTDWYTKELFGLPGIAASSTPISRVVIDLERFSDDSREEKAAFGQGVVYSHNTLGERFRREILPRERRHLLDTYYRPWHLQLEVNIEQQLTRWGHCLLLDCHSFPDKPFAYEDDGGFSRPDICLGGCGNTAQWLLDSCMDLFLQRGYTVGVDFPYTGCLVPLRYHGDLRVPAIMIEINRRLYLKPAARDVYRTGDLPARLSRFEALKNDIWTVMLSLCEEAGCRLGQPAGAGR